MLGMGQTELDLSQYYAQLGVPQTTRLTLDAQGYLTDATGTIVGQLDASGNLVPAATFSVTGTAKATVPSVAAPCKQTVFPTVKGFCDNYLWIGLAVLGGVLFMKGRR